MKLGDWPFTHNVFRMLSPSVLLSKLRRTREEESLQPDLGRAVRGTIAYMVPLLLAAYDWLPIEVSFMAVAAQNIATVDVRGDYRFRLGLLVAMTGVFVGAVSLGTIVSGNLAAALVATAFIAFCGGLWRHLSSDYGMGLAISSTLVFLIALASPSYASVADHAVAALVGGVWGILLQVALWPFRPQHPLRRTISDSWLAVADLFEAMTPDDTADAAARTQKVHEKEALLRSTLDKSYATLAAARTGLLRQRLEALNFAAARLATRVVALHTALENALGSAASTSLVPALLPALAALTNTSRTVALAVVSRQPAHLATCEVRLRRLTNLLRVLQARLKTQTDESPGTAQLVEILRQIEDHLPAIQNTLRATIDRADERTAFSLELFDLHTLTLRPLASALNFTTRVDPALARFTLRLSVLLVGGVAVFKLFHLEHGYWLPFTIVVVLQPDYGSTRLRAGQRALGTLGGGIVASGLLWLHLPFAALAVATAATIFTFGYWIRRNYGVAVFFITLFIVLVTETNGPVTVAFTIERLASTVAGVALALVAALIFWPVWERDRFPPILATAFRANRDYLRLLLARLSSGGSYDAEAQLAKRAAETANSAVFSSLQRMNGDPKNRQHGLEHAATLANGNQRLTRALNVLTLHLKPGAPLTSPELTRFAELSRAALDSLADSTEHNTVPHQQLEAQLRTMEAFVLPVPENSASAEHWIFTQLTRSTTELSAMLLAAIEAAPAQTADASAHTGHPWR